MTTYAEVIEAIIEKEKAVVGAQAAVDEAGKVGGLRVDGEGNVEEIEGEGNDILAALVERYVELYGDVAATLIARRLERMDLSGIRLPDILADRLE